MSTRRLRPPENTRDAGLLRLVFDDVTERSLSRPTSDMAQAPSDLLEAGKARGKNIPEVLPLHPHLARSGCWTMGWRTRQGSITFESTAIEERDKAARTA